MKKIYVIITIGIMISLNACGKSDSNNEITEFETYQASENIYESEKIEINIEESSSELINETIYDLEQGNKDRNDVVVFSDKTSDILPVGMNGLGETIIDCSDYMQLNEGVGEFFKYNEVDDGIYEVVEVQRADVTVYSFLKRNVKFEKEYQNIECYNYDVNTGKILALDNIVTDEKKLHASIIEQINLIYPDEKFLFTSEEIATELCDKLNCKWILGYQGLVFYIDSSLIDGMNNTCLPILISFKDYSSLYMEKFIQIPERYCIDVCINNLFLHDITNDNKTDKISIMCDAKSNGAIQKLSVKVNDKYKNIEIENLDDELRADYLRCNILQTDEEKKLLFISTSYMLEGMDYGIILEITDKKINIINQDISFAVKNFFVTDPYNIPCKGYGLLLGSIWDFETATCWKIQSDGQASKNIQEEYFLESDFKIQTSQVILADKIEPNNNNLVEKNIKIEPGTVLAPIKTDNATYVEFANENGYIYHIAFEMVYNEDYGYIGSIDGVGADKYMDIIVDSQRNR